MNDKKRENDEIRVYHNTCGGHAMIALTIDRKFHSSAHEQARFMVTEGLLCALFIIIVMTCESMKAWCGDEKVGRAS